VIFLAAGYVGYTQLLAPKKTKAAGTQVEVIGAIPSSLDQSALDTLNDPASTQDFTPTVDLTTGLGNAAPFGP